MWKKLQLAALLVLSFNSAALAAELLDTSHPLAGKIWDSQARSFIDETTLIQKTNVANVLLLGEIHDNQVHHERQQQLLKARIQSGAQPVVMMEQLDADKQVVLNHALANKQRDQALALANELITFSDKNFYTPFIEIAYDNKLQVVAANVSRAGLQGVIRGGYESYDPDELKRLVVEEVWNDARQKYLFGHMGGAHCGQLREEIRNGLARGQRLRDALMVDNALDYTQQGVVAIVGRDHARHDIGMPLYFKKRAPDTKVVSVGFIEVQTPYTDVNAYLSDSATGENAYDYIWFSPRMARENPCANFGK